MIPSTTAVDRLRRRAAVVGLMLVLSSVLSSVAMAQPRTPTAQERVLAEALFREAKVLMKEGRWDEACPKLEESHRLEPLAGVLLNMAVCHEEQGRTATAWSEFREALALAKIDGRKDRETLAQEHIEALEPLLAALTVVVPTALAELEGVVVERNGTPLVRAGWGTSVPVDPGEHEVLVRAPGYREHRVTVTVRPTSEQVVELPMLEPEEPEPPPVVAPPPPVEPEPPPPEPVPEAPPPDDPGMHPVEIAGWVMGGVGLAGVIVGAAFGADAVSQESLAKESCGDTTCPDQSSLDASDRAQASATISTVTFVGGLALVAGGISLLLLAPDENQSVSVAGSSLRYTLRW